MKKIILIFVLLIFMNSTIAQLTDSSWPVFHGDSKGTGLSEYDTSKVNGAVLWKFKTGKQIEASPVLAKDGTIYIPDQDCDLYAINPDGTLKWQFNGGDPVYSEEWDTWFCAQASPAVAKDGTIYFVTASKGLFAISPDGKEKWSYPVYVFKNVWSSPAIGSDGTVYVGSECYPNAESGKPQEIGGTLYAIKPDGTLKWKHDFGSSGVNPTAVFTDDGTIITATGDFDKNTGTFVNCVFAFNPDGSIRWKFHPDGIAEGSAVIAPDGTIYIGVKGKHNPKEGKFYALTPDGKEKWKFPLTSGMSVSPAIGKDGTVYFGEWGGIFYALTPDGKEIWHAQTPTSFETLSSSPAIGSDGTVYFGSTAGYFFAYTPDGKEKWKIEEGQGGFVSSPAISKDGIIYVATVPGELLAIGTGSGPTVLSPARKENKMIGDYWDKTCPEEIRLREHNTIYYGILGDREWDLTLTRQIDWISNNCPNTIWPGDSGKKPKQNASKGASQAGFEQNAVRVSDEHIVNARFFGETARSCLDSGCTAKKETCVRWDKNMKECYGYEEVCSFTPCSKYKTYCEIAIVSNDKEAVEINFNSNYETADGTKHLVQEQSFRLEPGSGNAVTWEYDVNTKDIGKCGYSDLKVNGKEKKETTPYCDKEVCEVSETTDSEPYDSATECGNGICEYGEKDYCHDDCDGIEKSKAKKGILDIIINFLKRFFEK